MDILSMSHLNDKNKREKLKQIMIPLRIWPVFANVDKECQDVCMPEGSITFNEPMCFRRSWYVIHGLYEWETPQYSFRILELLRPEVSVFQI